MLKKLTFKIPNRPFIASCIDFKERQEYCKLNLIPLLKKKNHNLKKKIIETFNNNNNNNNNNNIYVDNNLNNNNIHANNGIKDNNNNNNNKSFSKNDLKILIKEINNSTKTSYKKSNINEWINEINYIIKQRNNIAINKLNNLESKLLDIKINYINNIINNAQDLEVLACNINNLIIKLNNLNFNENYIFEKIDLNNLKKMTILISINNYLHKFYSLNNKLDQIILFLKEKNNLKCSEIYDIIKCFSCYIDSLILIESEKSIKLNIKSLIYKKINELLYFIKEILIINFSKLLKEYCDWGKFDKIFQEILNNNKSINNILDTEIEMSKINKNEKIINNITIILILISECQILILKCNNLMNLKIILNDEYYKNINICEEIISKLSIELLNLLKPLFFSKNSSLFNLEKPEWFFQTILSIFKSHSQYLENLWYLLDLNYNKIFRNIDKSEKLIKIGIPYYFNKENYIKIMKEIIKINSKKIFSICLISELRDFIKIYLRKILINNGIAMRDNRIDYIYEKFIEQLLIEYRSWNEIDKYSSHFIMFDILKNSNIKKILELKKNSLDNYLNEENNLNGVEDLTKTAVNWAKNAFSIVMGDFDLKYLEMFNNPSSFPLECGLLDWLCILNRIYVINQINNYKLESLVSSFLDKFNIKRTVQDLYKSINSYCGSSKRNDIIKWFSETIIYMLNESNKQNAQSLIMPIKSSDIDNKNEFILVLGYSIEIIELLNSFSAKISLFIDCCKSFEINKLDEYQINLIKYKFQDFSLDKFYLSKIFINHFTKPVIENTIINEFLNYIEIEWNKIGHKIGPLIPITCILIESLDIVNSTILNLNQEIYNEEYIKNKENNDSILNLYFNSLNILKEKKDDMMNDIKLEIKEVFIKPLKYNEIIITSLNDLINSNSFPGSAKLLFDTHLSEKVNELKYIFILFRTLLSKNNLIELTNILNE